MLPAISLKNRSSLQDHIPMEHIPVKSALTMEKRNPGGGPVTGKIGLSLADERRIIQKSELLNPVQSS